MRFVAYFFEVEGLEVFYPDRVASRILDMGDVLSLVEDLQDKIDVKKAKKILESHAKRKTHKKKATAAPVRRSRVKKR